MKPRLYTVLLLLCLCPAAYAQTDTAAAPPAVVKKDTARLPHQLRFGVDITQPIINAFLKTRQGYEFQADYALKKDVYCVLEFGWGSSNYNYPDLSYESKNQFFRIGVDKSMLTRLSNKDWDMLFVGARYGMSLISRGEGFYTTHDSLFSVNSGSIAGKNFMAHWAELTAGIRVEVFKGLFLGWNIRGKFLINQGAFKELPPAYLAGYGKGDKNTIFDYNFYVSYALRWHRQ